MAASDAFDLAIKVGELKKQFGIVDNNSVGARVHYIRNTVSIGDKAEWCRRDTGCCVCLIGFGGVRM